MENFNAIIRLCQKLDGINEYRSADRLSAILKKLGYNTASGFEFILVESTAGRVGYNDAQYIGPLILFKKTGENYEPTRNPEDWKRFIQYISGGYAPQGLEALMSSLPSENDVAIWNDLNQVPGGLKVNFPLGEIKIKKESIPWNKPPPPPALKRGQCVDLIDSSGTSIRPDIKSQLEKFGDQLIKLYIDPNIYTDDAKKGEKALRIVKELFPDADTRKRIYLAARCKQYLFSTHPRYKKYGREIKNGLYLNSDGTTRDSGGRENFLKFLEYLWIALDQIGGGTKKGTEQEDKEKLKKVKEGRPWGGWDNPGVPFTAPDSEQAYPIMPDKNPSNIVKGRLPIQ